MDPYDIETKEDLCDLESRLYAQVHHEAAEKTDGVVLEVNSSAPAPTVRIVTNKSVINRPAGSVSGCGGGRYWTERAPYPNTQKGSNPTSTIEGSQVSGNFRESNKTEIKMAEGGLAGLSSPAESQNKSEEKSTTETLKSTFRPYNPIISNIDSGVVPQASGNYPKSQGSTNKTDYTKRGSDNQQMPVAKARKPASKLAQITNQAQLKLQKLGKYQKKKTKANRARQKNQAKLLVVQTIVVESSDDCDDVVEIPVPPPPMVTLLSSDEESVAEEFAKPRAIKKTSNIKQTENSSRCTSPCSVMSDDFIGQTDRVRLLQNSNIVEDEDFQCIPQTVDSFIKATADQTASTSAGGRQNSQIHPDINFATPQKRGTGQSNQKKYINNEGTVSKYTSVDIYESESSDMPETVYATGVMKDDAPREITSGESMDIEIVPRTKRLQKRRTSSSNKSMDPNETDDSTNSDCEELNEFMAMTKTSTPHILRGEAVEGNRTNFRRKKIKKLQMDSSDKDFINMLSTIVHGDEDEEDTSDGERITAREIAEEVLRSSNQIAEVEDGDEAIPSALLPTLEKDLEALDRSFEKKSQPNGDDEDISVTTTDSKRSKKGRLAKVLKVVKTSDNHIGWNDEMIRFYDYSWGDEELNIRQIQRTMNRFGKWFIYSEDRFPKSRPPKAPKCYNCMEFGHTRSKCPRPKKDIHCYMCGEIGHREPRCPNTICLRCGRATNTFVKSCKSCASQIRSICPICKIRGHSVDYCPDKWRRYHSTTSVNQTINRKVVYNNRKFCCVCAQEGHLAEHCKSAARFMDYPLTVSQIKSHAPSYEGGISMPMDHMAYNLFYEPKENMSFRLTEGVTKNQYYGRFLSAVGLEKEWAEHRYLQEQLMGEPEIRVPKHNYVLNPFAKRLKRPKNSKNVSSSTVKCVATDKGLSNQSIAIEFSFKKEIRNLQETSKNFAPDVIKLNFSTTHENNDRKFISPKCEEFKQHWLNLSITQDVGKTGLPLANQSNDGNKLNESVDNSEVVTDLDSAQSQTKVEKSKKSLAKLEDAPVQDSPDSNYSFSEHFGQSNTEKSCPKIRELEPLPDFIPLPSDGEDESGDDNSGENDQIKDLRQKYMANLNEDVDMGETESSVCEAKVYLVPFYSRYLLTPIGQKFLVEKSQQNNVETSIDWTSAGNMLIIKGTASNQDKFHKELIGMFEQITDEVNRKILVQSQRVPRKRDRLIKFIQEHILLLEADLGNALDLYFRLQYAQRNMSKSSWKNAEKIRRNLNIVLIGKAGFNDGHKYVSALMDNLKTLQEANIEDVPDSLRDEIDNNWRYIFSSYRHDKYDEMVKQYVEMKNGNNFPKLELDPILLGKRTLDVSFPNIETKEHLNDCKESETKKSPSSPPKPPKKCENVKNPFSQRRSDNKSFNPNVRKDGRFQINQNFQINPSTSFNRSCPNQAPRRDKRINAQCQNFLSAMNNRKVTSNPQNGDAFWSRESVKVIDQCMKIVGNQNAILFDKLKKAKQKALNDLLSYNDFRSLNEIYNTMKSSR